MLQEKRTRTLQLDFRCILLGLCGYIRCGGRLLNCDFELSFFRRFSNVTKSIVSFRTHRLRRRRLRHKHNMMIFFSSGNFVFRQGRCYIPFDLMSRDPLSPPSIDEIAVCGPPFIVLTLVFILPILKTYACVPEGLIVPLSLHFISFPVTRPKQKYKNACIRIKSTTKKNLPFKIISFCFFGKSGRS